MNAKKKVWLTVDHHSGEVHASARAPSPERECALLEQGIGVYRRYVDLPETRPTTLRNLQADENANLRKQVAEGKARMAELRAECDRLTSAPVSQLRADLERQKALTESECARATAESNWRQKIANELSSVKDQLRTTSQELCRRTAALSEANEARTQALLAHQRLVNTVYGYAAGLPNIKALLTEIRDVLRDGPGTCAQINEFVQRINAVLSLLP